VVATHPPGGDPGGDALVPRTRNPKGIGLFAHALLDLHAAGGAGSEGAFGEAEDLLAWLLDHPAEGFRGLSWGYPYPWQDAGFFAPRDFPNRVVTSWIGLAFTEAARATGRAAYLEALARIAQFLTGEPRVLCDSREEMCLTYVPDASVDWAVVDVPALAGAFLAEAGALLDHPGLVDVARRLVRWVARRQTAYGAWFYTDPPAASHITHDNYHTAIVLDCLDRFSEATGEAEHDAAYRLGLEYYRDHLFTPAWAPRWMNDRRFPHDIHGAASAVLCFARAARRDPAWWGPATAVLDWALETMYDPRGYFYYQRTRWRTRRLFLMRWANAWMARAMAAVLRAARESEAGSTNGDR
jgi:hypothetical protein